MLAVEEWSRRSLNASKRACCVLADELNLQTLTSFLYKLPSNISPTLSRSSVS